MTERDAMALRRAKYKLPQCPGGYGCTCCHAGCDCGCVDRCPVYRKWNRLYVPPGRKLAHAPEATGTGGHKT